MVKPYFLIFLLFANALVECKKKPSQEKTVLNQERIHKKTPTKADTIVNKAIAAHGGELYNSAHYAFNFRGKKYTFKNNHNTYSYTVEQATDSTLTIDKLENGIFQRTINNEAVTLPKKKSDLYINNLNSVVYFTLLPYKLNDSAVNKYYLGATIIKNFNYHIIKVTFDEKGGGKDFEDEFYYWIHAENYTVDYLAYKYAVNGGGIRFRSFFNRTKVAGIIFQDYINWKAELDAPLITLPQLFETDKLKKVSTIENKLIRNLK